MYLMFVTKSQIYLLSQIDLNLSEILQSLIYLHISYSGLKPPIQYLQDTHGFLYIYPLTSVSNGTPTAMCSLVVSIHICTTIHRYQIFSTRYSVLCKIYTGYHGISEQSMVCAPVRSIIPSLKRGDYLAVQAHKPCSISHWYVERVKHSTKMIVNTKDSK